MSNGRIISVLPDRDLSDHKSLAELDQLAVGPEILAGRFAQEIDVEASGHRQQLPSARGEQCDVDRVVTERHDGGARDCRSRTLELLTKGLAEPASARPDLFDGKAAFAAPHLRKLGAQKAREFLSRERRCFHQVMSQDHVSSMWIASRRFLWAIPSQGTHSLAHRHRSV